MVGVAGLIFSPFIQFTIETRKECKEPLIFDHLLVAHAVTGAIPFLNKAKVEFLPQISHLQIYYLAYDKAKMMLQKNRLVLEKIVEELLQYEILTERDLERIIADNGGIREREPFFLSSTSAEEAVVSRLLDEKSSGTALLNAAN